MDRLGQDVGVVDGAVELAEVEQVLPVAEHEVDLLALAEREDLLQVVLLLFVGVDQRRAGGQQERLALAARQPDPVLELELRLDPGVVEGRFHHHLHVGPAADDLDRPADPLERPGAVRLGEDRHEVGHRDLGLVGDERGHQHVGVGQILLLGPELLADRAQAERTADARVEQLAERRRRVEPREAEPVDAGVLADQGGGFAIADNPVVEAGRGLGRSHTD